MLCSERDDTSQAMVVLSQETRSKRPVLQSLHAKNLEKGVKIKFSNSSALPSFSIRCALGTNAPPYHKIIRSALGHFVSQVAYNA
jgi:hypothetical protein